MKRNLALLLILGLIFGALAPSAVAKKKKKKPAPVDVVYHIVWGGETCALSIETALASEEDGCGDPFAGFGSATPLSTGAWEMAVLDGLPLTLDATKVIKGVIEVDSYYAVDVGADVIGIGQPELSVKLTGTSAGEELVLGEMTTDPYTVTPASAEYVVEFEFQPPAQMNGQVLDTLTLTLQVVGNSAFHGVFPADGTSTLTIGATQLI